MKERRFFLENLCEVTIRKRKGSRRMSIRINPEGEVRMSIPYNLSFREAEKFLEKKRDWIEKTRLKLEERKPEKIIYSNENPPRTRYHEFIISLSEDDRLSFRLSQGLCEVFVPSHNDLSSEMVQNWIRYAFTETLRKEAKIFLVNRCNELSTKMGISINNVRVKNMKTRWGSCSTRGNINLNIHLMRVPDHLADYVIYHELVHTLHHHHGAAFWRELDRHVGNAKSLAKEMRTWGWVLNE